MKKSTVYFILTIYEVVIGFTIAIGGTLGSMGFMIEMDNEFLGFVCSIFSMVTSAIIGIGIMGHSHRTINRANAGYYDE